jgi:uncharacterized protein (TIGR01777 family)
LLREAALRIVVAGGTGFLGSAIVERLAHDHSVEILSRDPECIAKGALRWADAPEAIASADVVVNLAGESIGSGRWTDAKKRKLTGSRVDSTKAIVAALASAPAGSRVLINASAVGFYGSRGDEVLTEDSSGGEDFLARLCREWEDAALEAGAVARVVVFRFGVVFGPGGALDRMILPFRLFAGGPLGSGRQWISWIDRQDVVGLISWAIATPAVRGIYNATSPGPVTSRELSREIGTILHRPSFLPTPAPVLRLALGEMADGLLLASQRAVPSKVLSQGYRFEFPSLSSSLGRILR